MFCICECIANDVVNYSEITLLLRTDFNFFSVHACAALFRHRSFVINSLSARTKGSGASIAVKCPP